MNRFSKALIFTIYGASALTTTAYAADEHVAQLQSSYQPGISFFSAAMQDTADLLSLSGTSLTGELSAAEKSLSPSISDNVYLAEDKPQTAFYELAQNAVAAPNTFGMLLAGVGMIGFMVARRRQQ